MQQELIDLLGATRHGHFRFESGHHGDVWLDIEPIFLRPADLRGIVKELAKRISRHNAEALCGPLTGGAFVAQMVANQLDLEFYYSERVARQQNNNALYSTQYRIPDALRGKINGKRVVIVDDVINAGSAVRATHMDVRACGAQPVAVAALLIFGSMISNFTSEKSISLEAIAHLPNHLWEPSECPLCAVHTPLENPARMEI
jgi:orotate phosphoribosyltransferase